MDIFELVNSREITTYYTENASNRVPYLGETLFPARKQLGLDLSWIKGSGGLPVLLKPSEFDAKATLRDRPKAQKVDTEMPMFREGMRIGEKDRQEILRAMGASNSQYIMPVLQRIYDDATNLIEGARATAELLRMQLLSTGKISVQFDRINYDYDYKLPQEHTETLTGEAQWSDPNSNPIEDIRTWQDTVEDNTGVRPARAICSRKTWSYLLNNKAIRLDMNPAGGQNIILTDSMLQQYLTSKLGISVAVYNKKYALEVGGASNQFFPDNVFTLIPDGTLGNTYYGTTNEEADLMAGVSNAEVNIVGTGIAVTSIKEPHPVNVYTVVSQICLPSFETIDNIFVAQVAGN